MVNYEPKYDVKTFSPSDSGDFIKSTLSIKNVQRNDQGTYKCISHNSISDSTTIEII